VYESYYSSNVFSRFGPQFEHGSQPGTITGYVMIVVYVRSCKVDLQYEGESYLLQNLKESAACLTAWVQRVLNLVLSAQVLELVEELAPPADKSRFLSTLRLEAATLWQGYGDVAASRSHLEAANEALGLQVELTGNATSAFLHLITRKRKEKVFHRMVEIHNFYLGWNRVTIKITEKRRTSGTGERWADVKGYGG
jgi:hypothetical protein